MTTTFTHVELAALAKAAATLAADAAVEPGVHPVDFTATVRVSGAVKKLEDGEYVPAPKLDLAGLLALALAEAGVSRADAGKALARMAEKAAEGKTPRSAAKDRLADAEKAVESLTAALKAKAVPAPRKGNLTATVAVEVVAVAHGANAAA